MALDMLQNGICVADKVEGLCRDLVVAGFYEQALKLSTDFFTLEKIVYEKFPTSLVRRLTPDYECQIFLQDRERYRDEFYNRHLKHYENFLVSPKIADSYFLPK